MNRQTRRKVLRSRAAETQETEDMSKNSPFKAGTKKLKKGWKYPRGGGRPVKSKASKKHRR